MAILELKAKLTFAAVAILVVCSACSKNHGSNPTAGAPKGHAIKVAVQTLKGTGLRLQNNGGDDLPVSANQTYYFATRLPAGAVYDVTVATQPSQPSQTCTVTNSSGIVGGGLVNVIVSCTTNTYSVGGTISGLDGQVTLQLKSGSSVRGTSTVDKPGPFAFATELRDETDYTVSVYIQPSVQTCSVSNAFGVLKGADATSAVITCQDNIPTVSVVGDSTIEGDTGTNYLTFSANLSQLARNDITVDYATADGTATTANSDYTATSGTLTILAGTSSGTITVPVLGDKNAEQNETLTLTLTNLSTNATFGVDSNKLPISSITATGTIYNDDGGLLNDTGITTCANGSTNGLPCNSIADGTDTYPGQDAQFGRDYTVNNDADGHAGFAFADIDANGNPTTACAKDLTTNLTWESKTTTVGGIHYKDATYSWYDSDGTSNGGEPGTANAGSACGLTSCDTQSFVTAVNADALCGYQDWRLPTVGELSNLIDSSRITAPTIDATWFPNTVGAIYWAAATYANYGLYAWGVNFSDGTVAGNLQKSVPRRVRLVRGP